MQIHLSEKQKLESKDINKSMEAVKEIYRGDVLPLEINNIPVKFYNYCGEFTSLTILESNTSNILIYKNEHTSLQIATKMCVTSENFGDVFDFLN